MNLLSQWGTALNQAFVEGLHKLSQNLPSIIGAFLLLLAGWIVARIMRILTMRAVMAIEQGLARLPGSRDVSRLKLPGASIAILGSLVFWLVLLFFLVAASQLLGFNAFSAWLARMVDYLPSLIAGGLIVLAGFLLSRLAREVIEAAAATTSSNQRRLLGKTTQVAIMVTAILVGADQIGIRITFLVVMAATLAGGIVIAVSLAVSLGSRNYVANLIGSHYLRQAYSVGQKIRVAGYEGKILDITPTSVVLETADGRASLPAKVFNEEPIIALVEHESHV